MHVSFSALDTTVVSRGGIAEIYEDLKKETFPYVLNSRWRCDKNLEITSF